MKNIFEAGKIVISIMLGLFINSVGGLDESMIILLIMILVDIISGLMKSLYNRDLNSEKMWLGGIKKMAMLLVVFVAVQIERYLAPNIYLREITIIYYVVDEGISFIENISVFINLPDEFTKFFKQIKNNESGEN